MRRVLNIKADSWDPTRPDPFYRLVFYKIMNLFCMLGLALIFLTGLVKRGEWDTIVTLQVAGLLMLSILHLAVNEMHKMRWGASIFVLIFFMMICTMIMSSKSGDASGVYHYVAPFLLVTALLLGTKIALAFYFFVSFAYLSIGFNLINDFFLNHIPNVVPLRSVIYIDRILECTFVLAGTLVYKKIKDAQQDQMKNQEKIKAEKSHLQALNSIVGGTAHEINNPLAIILGHLEILDRLSQSRTEREIKAIESIKSSTERIHQFVESILFLTQSLEEKDEYLPLRASLDLAIKASQKADGFPYDRGYSSIKNTVDPNIQVFLNASALENILGAITTNALEAIQNQATATVEWYAKKIETGLLLCCEDSGPDYDATSIGNFTDPLYTTKLDRPRRGIGLAMVNKIIVEKGWSISIVRSQGKTTVSIEIPQRSLRFA